jgi:branched-chain amino acid transport system permease protein
MFSTSILVVIMIILGGIGNIWGVLLGAVVVQYVDKTLLGWVGARLSDIGNATGLEHLGDINPSQFSFLLLGIVLVAMMRFRPEGFLPSRQRAAEMHTAPPGQAIGSIGLLEEEGVVPEIDLTEPGGAEDPELVELPDDQSVDREPPR